ncbi:MAG: DUF1150 family protein [Halocynthiibacter sp.]
MDTKFDFDKALGDRRVYVRSVDPAELPKDLLARIDGVPALYAVCDADGNQLALAANRKLAFLLARQNNFSPVSVH